MWAMRTTYQMGMEIPPLKGALLRRDDVSRVLTTLENLEDLEISGNLLILKNSRKTRGIKNFLREFIRCLLLFHDTV